MALSLQQEQQSQDLQWEQLPEGISDLELAKKLQEEEDRRASQYYQEQEQEQAAAAAAAAAAQAQVWRQQMQWRGGLEEFKTKKQCVDYLQKQHVHPITLTLRT